MKTKILTFFLTFTIGGLFFNISAQETARERINRQQQGTQSNTSVGLSIRAEQMNRTQSADISDAKWTRVVYRYLDLSKEANAPLYYPVIPEQGRMNLFTMMFKLLSENKIKAYEYLDGREDFSDEYAIDFNEFLNRFGIYYENQNGNIVINDVDIPSNEVQGYYIKEAYFFETGTSNYGLKTVAICPIIHRQGDYEASTTRYPLFWIPYDEIRPYALRMPIMTSSLNNTMTGTIDDFFRKNNYDGEIYKTTNPRNLAITQYASTPEAMKAEQERIEKQLTDFEKNLWQKTDTIPPAKQQSKRRIFRKSSAKSTSGGSGNSMRDRRY
ncbi:MAG: gliding motility protein GldN [Bacteroidia bacterium]|nr:gliding motility protein GldN [Bacteroidia bacterium]